MAAIFHCDKHVVKMIIESAQLLSTAHHEHGHSVTYKPTHKNHPSAVWTRESKLHYNYVYDLAIALCQEYTKRYGKIHACEAILRNELRDPPPSLTFGGWINPPQCMPDEYKTSDTVQAYRQYYRHKKNIMSMKWHQDKHYAPDWMNNEH
jgi:hypothetical protein